MEYYQYKVKNPESGRLTRGVVTADDMESAVDTLKKRGETVVEIDYLHDFLNLRKLSFSMSNKITKRITCDFATMLSYMLGAGMSLYEALVNIRDGAVTQKMRLLARTLADEVRRGAGLSQAMSKSQKFGRSIVEQINAGEESGNVPQALKRLSQQLEREMEFAGKIKSAMMYPIIITVVMIAVLWVLMTVVVPTLSQTLLSMGGELPVLTKIVIGVSGFLSKATPYIFIMLIGGFITYKILMKKPTFRYKVDCLKLKIPIIGAMLLKLEMSRFCRSLSAMQQSGITLVASLKITGASIKNASLARSVEKAARLVELSGMNLAAALTKTGEFPSTMLQLIAVGIASGNISDVLDAVGAQYEKEVDTSLKRITGMIEPIMIVVVGILAGVVVISIFQPMFSVVDTF